MGISSETIIIRNSPLASFPDCFLHFSDPLHSVLDPISCKRDHLLHVHKYMYSTLHADSPISAKLQGKIFAPRIYDYFQRPFSSEFSHPPIFYQPSEDKLRELRRFASAELRGNKMAAIDDFCIKLHLAWQFCALV